MIKMPCLFVRSFHGPGSFTLTAIVTPGCEWVINGEGIASRKRDGTACMYKDGTLYKRYDAKRPPLGGKVGRIKEPPKGAIPCSEPDPITGHWPHWVPIGPHDYWHREAFERQAGILVDGETYELCGPKLQGNPERLIEHTLIQHGIEGWNINRSFDELRHTLASVPFEGFVFKHPDGRYAKIRRHDYGLDWPLTTAQWKALTPQPWMEEE